MPVVALRSMLPAHSIHSSLPLGSLAKLGSLEVSKEASFFASLYPSYSHFHFLFLPFACITSVLFFEFLGNFIKIAVLTIVAKSKPAATQGHNWFP
jgi:hypothetical protein